ncbi:MAG TPA: cation:proton antiporter [Pseudonocardiaceae bacterium]|nr:cation:proton antiporter [Pseudonocardiaceae bacterium]
MPVLPLGAALALAAVVAPPDAVAAVSIGRRLGLPPRVMTVLTGESLFNDATALTALRVAVAATVGTGFSLWSGSAGSCSSRPAVWCWVRCSAGWCIRSGCGCTTRGWKVRSAW